jgi:hypothetical protein
MSSKKPPASQKEFQFSAISIRAEQAKLTHFPQRDKRPAGAQIPAQEASVDGEIYEPCAGLASAAVG